MKKFLSFFLVVLIFVFAGCENVEYHTESSSEEVSLEFYDQLESQLPSLETPEEGRDFVILTDSKATFLPDDNAPESVSLAVSERNSFLEMKYGINIIVKELNASEIANELMVAEKSGNRICDMISVSAEETVKLFTAGLLGDFNKLTNFNLENGFFDTELTRPLATNNSIYMLADPSTNPFDNASVIFYNRNLFKAPEGGEDVETLALQGKWTWDKFNEYCRSSVPDAYSSRGGDVKKDTFAFGSGFSDEDFVASMWSSCNQSMVSDSYKQPIELTSRDEAMPTIEFLRAAFNVRGRFPLAGNDARNAFEEGRLAFYCDNLGYIHNLRDGSAKGTEFGFLPMPKMNEEQESYRCLLNPDARVISIPKSLENADDETKNFVSVIISATCAAGGVTMEKAYETTLLGLYLISNNEILLTQTIINSVNFDFAVTFGSAIDEIYKPTIKPIADSVSKGLSFTTAGKQDFKEYCETNFQ